MGDCPFCDRIAASEFDISNAAGDVVSFEPLNPVTRGHRLVVPRRHVAHAGIDPPLTGKVAALAAEIGYEFSGFFNLITSAGAPASQTVMHLHIHVVPRREGDGLRLPWTWQEAAGKERETAVTATKAKAERDAMLLAVLRDAGKPLSVSDILAALEGNPANRWDWTYERVRTDLLYLKRKRGAVWHPARGRWAVSDHAPGEDGTGGSNEHERQEQPR